MPIPRKFFYLQIGLYESDFIFLPNTHPSGIIWVLGILSTKTPLLIQRREDNFFFVSSVCLRRGFGFAEERALYFKPFKDNEIAFL